MKNRNIEVTWEYHNKTKHPGMPPHYLDWSNQPIPFKIYETLEPIKIPADLPPSNVLTLTAISESATKEIECLPDLKTLGRLLYLSAGITKKANYPGGEIYFRAAACTGALYHIDLYLVTKDIEGLDAGVYHFGPHDFSLRVLRKGDYRGVVVNATVEESTIATAPITIITTSTFWRNSWKYQSRAYRHTFWDTGTILANLLAAASAYNIPAGIVTGFLDSDINNLLGLDTNREVSICLVSLGKTKEPVKAESDEIQTINYETTPLSRSEINYPLIRSMHDSSSLTSEEEVREWRMGAFESIQLECTGRLFSLEVQANKSNGQISKTIEETILKRGSTRQFAQTPITFKELSNTLYYSAREVPADFLLLKSSTLNDLYLIVNDVEGIPKGAYCYRRDINALELLKDGDFRNEAGRLGLGQDIPADASVNVFFLTDLNHVLEKFGNRGYRAAELEAGIIGGKLYLGAYAQGLGASGLTFFDDEVIRFFSPHAQGKSAMFLVALGKSVKRGLR